MNKKCIGCGALLQTEKETKKGFTKSLEMNYCMRCFRWTHYGDYKKGQEIILKEEVLSKLNSKKGFVFFFIDFLNLHEESIRCFKDITLPKVFVISKLDTIPECIYLEKIKIWLKNIWKINEDILFIQQNSKTSIKKIEEKILASGHQTIYFAGMTNAGKSTFLNSFFETNEITVSEIPNTTLDFMKLQMGDFTIYDTPGIPYNVCKLDVSFLKKANASNEINPLNYPLKKEASLILEDYIRITFDCDNNITFFGSNKLRFQKVYEKNKRLLECNRIDLQIPKNSNVYLKGIGFFYIKKSSKMTLYGMEKENISVVPSFLG